MFHTLTSQRNRGQTVGPPFISVERMFIAVERPFFDVDPGTLKTTKLRLKLWECIFEVEKGGAHRKGKSIIFPNKPSLEV